MAGATGISTAPADGTGRPRDAPSGLEGMTLSRARSRAGGALVGFQSESPARTPVNPRHSPSVRPRPAAERILMGLPLFPGCTARLFIYASRLHYKPVSRRTGVLARPMRC